MPVVIVTYGDIVNGGDGAGLVERQLGPATGRAKERSEWDNWDGERSVAMLYAFGFERVGVVVGDLYFMDPEPIKGQEGAEHGVRLELRVLDRGELKGTIYSATPIEVGRPIWRVDLLESVDGKPGSFDRTHHHPVFKQWNPTKRVFVRELSADPLGWLGGKLTDLDKILAGAGFAPDTAGRDDAADLRAAAPEIVDVTRRLLDKVRAGELGNPPRDAPADHEATSDAAQQVLVRAGWL
jgi:hypothetical protein